LLIVLNVPFFLLLDFSSVVSDCFGFGFGSGFDLDSCFESGFESGFDSCFAFCVLFGCGFAFSVALERCVR